MSVDPPTFLPTWQIVLAFVDVPALLFHASMFLFLTVQICQKRKPFHSGFYILYAILSFADIVEVLWTYVFARGWGYAWYFGFLVSSKTTATISMQVSCYVYAFQATSHVFIALNRFTALCYPMRHTKMFSGSGIVVVIGANIGACFVLTSFRLPSPAVFISNGTTLGLRYEDLRIQFFATTQASATTIGTATVCLVLELATFFKYRRLMHNGGKTSKRQYRADLRLLVYAMLTLVCQLMLAVYQAMVLYGVVANDFAVLLLAQRHYAWLIDLSSLSGSIFLFAIR